jgi:hypothetical protein
MPYTDKDKQKQAQHEYYLRNKEKYLESQRQSRKKIRIFLRQYKEDKKCSRCSENHPACLDFHHIDPKNKLFTIGLEALSRKLSISKIEEEIKKCEILCSNCHRKLHYIED